ncbi:hypothetical protein EMIT0P201_50272 [Pseudomonas chlororaphis]
MSPDGGIGRRGGFKIRFREKWEFESPSGHHIAVSESLYQTLRPRETGHLSRFFCVWLSTSVSPYPLYPCIPACILRKIPNFGIQG